MPTKPSKQFIEECAQVHDDKYDYTNTIYTGLTKPITYVCPTHGAQTQLAVVHLHQKGGCPACGRRRTINSYQDDLQGFLTKASAKHGDTYNYSKVIYVNSAEKIKIICKIHGVFKQTPHLHARGRGCWQCRKPRGSSSRPMTTPEFISKAGEIHGTQYDYSGTIFNGPCRNLLIGCRIHGSFKCEARLHLEGEGCSKCKKFEIFAKRAKELQNGRYAYNVKDFTFLKKKMKITCKKHSEVFEQSPSEHLRRSSPFHCPQCRLQNGKLTVAQIVQRSVAVHGDSYNYSNVTLTGNSYSSKVAIFCNKCQEDFMQTPKGHLSGKGCPRCCLSHSERTVRNWLIANNVIFEEQKVFPGLKSIKSLRCDFFLKELNLVIEFDGIQHFEPVSCFGGEEKFLLVVSRDQKKNEYCAKNRINLLRIKDGENIEEQIATIISKIQEDGDMCFHLKYGDLRIF